MTSNEVLAILSANGMNPKTYEERNRIYIGSSNKFNEFIEKTENGFHIKVFLQFVKFGDKYTFAQFQECMVERSRLVEKLNSFNNPNLTFNEDGESNVQ